MTNKIAIEYLKDMLASAEANLHVPDMAEHAEALDMAIEALSTSQNLSEPNNELKGYDLISRQDAINVVKGIDSYFVKYIEDLPSAQRTGEWIERDSNGVWECNQCHKYSMIYKANYCPFCGAKMKNNGDD